MQATERGTGMERSRSGVGNVGARGFTLIEMIVVIVIFMILMGLGLIAYDSMKVDNALNASAMELASTFREARGLALRHKKHYTVAFSAIKEDWSGGDSQHWTQIGEPTERNNTRLHNAVFPERRAESSEDQPSGEEFNSYFRSDNENGTDHWYAIYKPFRYGSVAPYGSVEPDRDDRDGWYANATIPDIYRPVQWWHLYGNNQIPSIKDGEIAKNTYSSTGRDQDVKNHKRFDERKYDPHRLQVGSRRFLQRGVRFWQFNQDPDDFVERGGDLTDYLPVTRPSGGTWRFDHTGSGYFGSHSLGGWNRNHDAPYPWRSIQKLDPSEPWTGNIRRVGVCPYGHRRSDRDSGGGEQSEAIRMAMLMGPTTIRTLGIPRHENGTMGNVVDSLVAFPDGTFGRPGVYGNNFLSNVESNNNRRRSANFISQANYSAFGALTDGKGGTGSTHAQGRRFVIGLVWREDRTKQRSVQINHTNGEVRIRREWNRRLD